MRKVADAPLLAARLATGAVLASMWLGCEALEPAASAPPATEPPLAGALCAAGCARGIRCEGPRTAACDCEGRSGPEVLRPAWAAAEIACLARTSCDGPDECATEAYRAIDAGPFDWPPVVMRCLQRGASCGGSSETCRHLAALNDDARAEVAPCFDLECADYATCLASFVATRIATAVPTWR